MSTYVVRPTPEIWHQPGWIILEMEGKRVVRNIDGIYPDPDWAQAEADRLTLEGAAS